jgi:hypothetical protein
MGIDVMSTVCLPITERYNDYVDTNAVEPDALATNVAKESDDQNRAAWDAAFDQLAKWGMSPGAIDDDGLEFPSVEALKSAGISLRHLRRDLGFPAPSRLVEDGGGGLVVRWIHDPVIISLRFTESGKVEFSYFEGTRLVGRILKRVDALLV